MNFAARLLAEGDPQKPALITLEAEHTYAELRAAAWTIARGLIQKGAQKGECVGIVSDNSFFWVAVYLGVLRAGCVAVPVSPALAPEDCKALAAATRMRFAFAEARLAAKAQWLEALEFVAHEEALTAAAADVELPVSGDEDLAAILFSSGSTGKPRGVMLSHRNLLANTASISEALGLTEDDRAMQVLPFHYSFGASVLQTHLFKGATVVIDKRFFPDKVLQRMIETRCTGFAGVPSHYQILLRKSRFKQLHFPALRWLQQAGGKLQEAFVREIREAKPDVKLFVMYGATEATARLSILPHDQLDTHLGSIGRGIPGVTLRVLDEQGNEVGPGGTGEIVAEGDNISRGYFNDPDESANTFRGGRLHTGDLATVDQDGFITVIGRAKSFLKCGGTRMAADKFEEALLAFDGIVEAAVIGIPDEVMGEAPAAFVVARDPDDAAVLQRLRAFADANLPIALRPKLIELVSELPKSAAGKVQRAKLHERLRAPAAAA